MGAACESRQAGERTNLGLWVQGFDVVGKRPSDRGNFDCPTCQVSVPGKPPAQMVGGTTHMQIWDANGSWTSALLGTMNTLHS